MEEKLREELEKLYEKYGYMEYRPVFGKKPEEGEPYRTGHNESYSYAVYIEHEKTWIEVYKRDSLELVETIWLDDDTRETLKNLMNKYGTMKPIIRWGQNGDPYIYRNNNYSIESYNGYFKVYNCKTHSLVEIIGTIPEQHILTPEEQAYINQRIEYFKRDREIRISEGNYSTEPYKHNLRKWSKKPSLWSKIKSVFPK